MEGSQAGIKLEGSKNWNVWKFQTMVVLRGHGLLDVVEGREVKPEAAGTAAEAWASKDAKAQTFLVTRMTEEVMLHIITCSSSADMWKKLASVYEQKTETSVHIVQQRFFQYKYEEGIEMAVFLSKVQEMKNQLKQMNEDISDKLVITKVLMSLPEDFSHFISAWESAPDDKQTYDNLVARLLVEEERIKEKRSESNQSSAFMAKRFDKKSVKCYRCNKLGHFQSECHSKVDNQNSASSSVNNRHQNFNNSNRKCFYCNKVGHFKSECRFNKNKNNGNAFVVQETFNEHFQQSQWLVDSGASEHMCCDRELFSSYSTLSQKSVIVGNGTAISALGRGQVAAQVFNGSEWIDTTIDNVLFVPVLKTNLFSVNRAADRGYVMLTDDSGCKFYKQKQVCAIANRVGNMYYMDLRYKNSAANVTQVKSELYEWHERLVHQNMQYVKTVLAKNNIQVQDSDVDQCQGCLEGKIHKLPFSTSETKTSRTCELIHADTCGPMEETSVGGSRYFVILKDDYSNYRSVYFVKGKDEVKKCIEDFINQSQNITGNKVKTFRSDNGLEFVNKEVKQLFQLHGIVHQTTVPYTPEQNGKAERENRTLVEAARTMLYSKDMPKKLWAEAINTAAYVLNRTGKSNEPGKTPFETWTKETFDINTLKIFGTPVFVHIPKEKRRKWDSKGEKGVMVGYGQHVKGYRIYFPNKNDVETKRDVVFIEQKERTEVPEEREPLVSLDVEAGMPEPSYEGHVNEECAVIQQNVQDINVGSDDRLLPGESSDSEYEPCATSEESAEEVAERPYQEVRRGQRTRKPNPRYMCNNVTTETEYPSTYQEAMRRKDASKWEEAVKRELDTLKENETWTICEGHDGHNSVSCKWVFKVKNCNNLTQYKARLVARGFEQNDMFNLGEIYAPVAKMSTFRLFIAVATNMNLPIYQMDVTGAFLYGDIDEDVFIKLPEGAYSNENERIVKLNKSLYGLKKSPKYWNEKFNSVITKEGFASSKCDSCFYSRCNSNSQTYVLLYVDDILIFGNDEKQICDLKSKLNKEFKMKDLGLVSNFLGINVKQDLENNITTLDQKEYLENVLKRFDMQDCKPMSTPMDPNSTEIFKNCKLDKNSENLCRQIIGCLMYAVCGTRPDLCVALSILSRYQNRADNVLLTALKRVLRYVKHTLSYKIEYVCSGETLVGWVDADWASDVEDRKSTTGYVFFYKNCLVSWSSKKQCSVSLSSTESEYVAMSVAASEACWLINMLDDFNIKNVCPLNIMCDNQSAMMAASSDSIKRLKHVDIRFHFVKELVKREKLKLMYVKSEDQIADMFTKPLRKESLLKFCFMCGLKN